MDIVALGELLIDFSIAGPPQEPWRSIRGSAGGAPANVLAAASKLGLNTRFIGKVGDDAFGDFLAATLRDLSVDTSALLRAEARTTLAFVSIDNQGERSFRFERNPGADTTLNAEELREAWFQGAKVFHYGSLSLTTEPSRSATWRAVEIAKQQGSVISFDPNLRRPLWSDLHLAKGLMLDGIRRSDIIKVSEEELTFLTDVHDVLEGIKHIQVANPRALFLVTCGDKGAYYATSEFVGHIPSIHVRAIDTTAAGDAFLGAFLFRYVKFAADLQSFFQEEEMIKAFVRFASVAGALTTTKVGAIQALPSLGDINEYDQQDGRFV
jgi:fructokinase